jgi:tetraacyldisaccharide 4'-kinase
VLRLLEVPYRLAAAWRNRRYDRGQATIHRVATRVISVGNITCGGTGKTPMVEWLARWFRRRGVRVTLISRGYGAEAGARNDEALELEQKLPDVPHLQNADRVAAARIAIEQLESQLILLDDAFQHRRIHRDLDIVLIDALEPFGYEHLLPRGLLREPVAALGRAQVIALSRADLVSGPERSRILARVRTEAPSAICLEIAHRPQSLLAWPARQEKIESLGGKRVAAFCGIGNPRGFQRTLASCGFDVIAFRQFPDHHPFRREDIESLESWCRNVEPAAVVCTHKDLVKIQIERLGSFPLRALAIGIEVLSGREDLELRLEQIALKAAN